MADPVLQLFEEYVAAFAAGERPDLRAYLARAGAARDELAELVDRFLVWADAPEPDDDAVAIAQAWIGGEAPLVALRVRRGLTRDRVVDGLMSRLGLPASLAGKLRRRYHELETGQLDVRRASPALLDELAAVFKTRVADLVAWQPRPLAAAAHEVFYRAEPAGTFTQPAVPLMRESEEPDEVDRLFLGV